MVCDRVTLILVTYNRLEILKKNLNHVRGQFRKPDHVLIVNNASSDGTSQFLKGQKEFDFIEMESNQGFGSGLHFGVKEAINKWSPEYFWLMDDDSFPNPAVLSSLYETMVDQKISGILGLTGFKIKFGIPRTVDSNKSIEESSFVLVDNALVSSDAFKQSGNFSCDFFMMCEDYEFCLRLRKHGFFVGVLNSESAIVDRKHLGSQVDSHNLIWRGYYHSRNHLMILKGFFSFQALFFYFYRQTKYLIHSSLFGKNRWLRTKYRLLGILDGFKNVKGKTIDPVTLKRIY